MIREITEKIVESLKKWAGKKTGSKNLEKTSPQVFPLDEQSFKKIRKKNFLYVDKTKFIAKLINRQSTYFFLSRPRRFGKSLLVSTMKEVFSGHRELFKDLDIYNQIQWETFPVINMDFSKIGAGETFSLEEALVKEVDHLAGFYNLPIEKGDHKTRFRFLIENLAAKTHQPVVVLIDEYDYFIVRYLTDDLKREKNREVMKEFFSVLKPSSEFLRFVFITGVSRFSCVSIFSDLNNLIDLTFDPDYSAIAGYTEEELSEYFLNFIHRFAKKENCTVDYLWNFIRKWYNGYSWDGTTRIYNPYSILKLFTEYRFDDYWYASGTPSFLIEFIRKKNIKLHELTDIKVNRSRLENMEVTKLELIPVMFQTGYLTIVKKIKESIEHEKFLVDYPNKDVRHSFLDHLMQNFSNENSRLIDYIIQALQNKEIDRAGN